MKNKKTVEQPQLRRNRPNIRPVWILVALAFFVFAQAYHLFFSTYRIQTPILIHFQPLITPRFVSPVPDDHDPKAVINNTEPDIKVITPKPTSTPTPTPTPKKRVSLHFAPAVEAKEITVQDTESSVPSDAEIIAYIQSKDWDDATAVALAKSENFWNLTKSFDCQRTGAQNKNGTRDHGLWQINDIHIKSGAITLKDANDCFKATDFAYGLYKGRGNTFGAWAAFNNGSYLNHL